MSRNRTWTLVKWLWLTAVVAALAWFITDRWAQTLDYIIELGILAAFVVMIAILLAKLLLVEVSRNAAARTDIQLSRWDAFRIYNLTQLGKYIPGAIWHLVGKAVLLSRTRANAINVRDAMVVEFFWVTGAAVGASVVGCFAWSRPAMPTVPTFAFGAALTAALCVAVVVGALLVIGRGESGFIKRMKLEGMFRRLIPRSIDVVSLGAIWLLLGVSFWVVCTPFASGTFSLGLAITVYSLAYVGGVLAPFAPAGLGVREGIIVWLLSGHAIEPSSILLACVVHRVLYFGVELALAASIPLGSCWRRT